MPRITDPMNALMLLQQAIDDDLVTLQKCEINPELVVLYDSPIDTPRFTYALLSGRKVKSIALFVLTKKIEGIPCFQMGWATLDSERRNGLAKNVVSKGLVELKTGMKRNGINKFYIEAIIAESNLASTKLASNIYSAAPLPCIDEFSNTSALRFFQAVHEHL